MSTSEQKYATVLFDKPLESLFFVRLMHMFTDTKDNSLFRFFSFQPLKFWLIQQTGRKCEWAKVVRFIINFGTQLIIFDLQKKVSVHFNTLCKIFSTSAHKFNQQFHFQFQNVYLRQFYQLI